jgi:hypothetical protein
MFARACIVARQRARAYPAATGRRAQLRGNFCRADRTSFRKSVQKVGENDVKIRLFLDNIEMQHPKCC